MLRKLTATFKGHPSAPEMFAEPVEAAIATARDADAASEGDADTMSGQAAVPVVERIDVPFPEIAVLKAMAGTAPEVAVVVAQTITGCLSPNAARLVDRLAALDIPALIVVMTQRPAYVDDGLIARAEGVVVTRDVGGPFRGWAMALAMYPQLYGCDRLHLVADTLVVATEGTTFEDMIADVRQAPDSLQALSASLVDDWHFQPHFLSLGPALVSSVELEAYFGSIVQEAKGDRARPQRFAWEMEACGYRARLLFQVATGLDPTLDAWPDMLRAGCPFVRASVLIDGSEAAIEARIAMLREHGFDIDLLEQVLLWESEVPTGLAEPRLLARPYAQSDHGRPLTIACFAPWHVEGAAADLAHALVAAFRRAGHKVNLLPSCLPTRTRWIAPPVAIREFLEPPQLAVLIGAPGSSVNALPLDHAHTFLSAPNRVAAWAGPIPAEDTTWLSAQSGLQQIWSAPSETAERLRYDVDLPVRMLPAIGASVDEWDAAAGSLIDGMRGGGGQPQPHELLSIKADAGVPVTTHRAADDVQVIAVDVDGITSPAALAAMQEIGRGWLVFAPSEAFLAPGFVERLHVHAAARPDVALFYADDVASEVGEATDQIRLKPELDVTLLASQDYVGYPVFVRAQALGELGGLDDAAGTAAILDLVFRIDRHGLPIARIPEVLLAFTASRPFAKPADHRAVLARRSDLGDCDIVPGRVPHSLSVRPRFSIIGHPPVTIVIPTCRAPSAEGGSTFIERLLAALATTDWPMDRLTVLVGDDRDDEPAWAKADWPFRLEWHATPREAGAAFNYASKMNALWRLSRDEQVVLMNDDILPGDAGWLAALQGHALRSDVGGVGGRLLYEDGRLQHAGIAPYGDGVGHIWVGRQRAAGTYQDWALVAREWSMVTGALFATRRSLLETMGGFDERLRLEYNDTDLCLRLRAAGYRIVYTPDAEMIHAEKQSRGDAPPPGSDRAIFMLRWREWLANDPSWHPLLRSRSRMMVPQPEPDAWYL